MKFSDLIKPGEAAQMALRRELERRRQLWSGGAEYVYAGAGDMILRHGEFFPGAELPEQYASSAYQETQCFVNALAAAEQHPELRYFEGVYSMGNGHFTPHAWCVDPDGNVVEVTVPTTNLERYNDHRGLPMLPLQQWAYAGLEFSPAYVMAHLEQHGLPMLDRPAADKQEYASLGLDMEDHDHDFPVLKVVYDPKRATL